ncbi:phage tail sheath family protein [Pedobacter sp. KBW06]|uniref:phage tail sheath family protein n=1 Tax=Pedobacter sp. KBW06 TaxID=2153359 RepID=UPI000F5B27AE|nr:phage tail sheath C-terminal domain-containing protein [Pedobacter sp. KBW06]RQO66361.1 phage tail sheath family protein [Pedobacter sp. KBW06]
MQDYKTPGVYIEEIPHLPPSIASVETAIPAFIGYTEKAQWKEADDLKNKPWRIESLLQYEQFFGYPDPEKESLSVVFDTTAGKNEVNGKIDETKRSKFLMYYSLQLFFGNGGGACWITSVGNYTDAGGLIMAADLSAGLKQVAKINEVTLLVFPDSVNLATLTDYYDIHTQAIQQCVDLQDRFTVLDVYHDAANLEEWELDVKALRDTLSGTTDFLKYAAVYFPKIYSGVDYNYKVVGDQSKDNDDLVKITGIAGVTKLSELLATKNAQYFQAKSAITNIQMLLPASVAVVGVYAQVDNARGVWKAPANINIANAIRPQYLITHSEQMGLNVDAQAGKSINVIRSFAGRGPAIIWGARTLAGNDNEWRYVPVRRFFSMVEESVKNATEQFVFEPNDRNTWVRVKSMIENYLTQQWKSGALMGASTKEAFFVHIGLGETMTELDLWEGRMIVEIGMAAVRPAEFIILRFMHKMLAES